MIQPSWQALPAGVDIAITKGNLYAFVASTSNAKADLLDQAAKHGLNVFDYGETSADSGGSRQIHAMAQATASGATIPWYPSFPASLVAHYNILQAWSAPPPQDSPPVTPSTDVAPPTSSGMTPVYVTMAVVASIAGVAWWLRSRHGRKLLR